MSRGYINPQYGHVQKCTLYVVLRTPYNQPISAQSVNYSDFHKNRVCYNIYTTNEAIFENVII